MKGGFLQKLYARKGGIKLGIGRVAAAFPKILNKKIPAYHVAGTNGKGTVVYALSHILEKNGFKTGRFISPHLVEFNERIAIDGIDITDDEVASLYNYLEKNLDDFDDLSFFEITFLMAWKHFENNNCDRVVIEVGLGGRIDATNVIDWKKTDIITSIGLDHMHILGSTLEEIATEKMGIIKKGDTVLLGGDKNNVFFNWLKDESQKRAAREVFFLSGNEYYNETKHLDLSKVQKNNIRLACKAVEKTEEKVVFPSFKELLLPGRFQKVDKNIFIDIAHNKPAIEALVERIGETEKNNVNFIYGSMKDKDISSVLDILADVADKIFVVSVDEENRGAKVEDVVQKSSAKMKEKLLFCQNDIKTMETAVNDSQKFKKTLVVTGSFYTIEKFLRWKNEKGIS
jgi:dihydrofolate synthase / folylpolyglutamate synthase